MTVDDFIQVLEKSTLLSAEQIQAARQQAAGESDPKMVARKLLSDGQLTKWQARQLLHGRYALTIGAYKLLDQLAGDQSAGANVARTFFVQHGESGQKAELRSLSRSHAAAHPEAVDQFVAAAEQASAAENRKLFEVHRPDASDNTCYVVLEEPVGGMATNAASASSDSAVAVEPATAETQAAQPNREKAMPAEEQRLSPETASAAAEVRPPKLKTKAKPASTASVAAATDTSVPLDKPASQNKPADKPSTAAPSSPAVEIKLPGEAAPAVAAAAPREFKIATGKRRKKPGAAPDEKPAKAQKPEKTDTPDGAGTAEGAEPAEDDLAAPVGSGRKLSPKVLIGSAIGGGLLLVAGVVMVWLLSRGGDSQVADAGAATEAAQQMADAAPHDGAGGAAPGGTQVSPESEPADPVVDPEVVVEVVAANNSEPGTEAEAPAATEVSPPAAGNSEMTESPASSGAKETKPSEAPAAQDSATAAKADAPAPEPAEAKSESPAEKPAAEKPAADKPPADKPPAEKPAADPAEKTEGDKPAETKPPAPPPAKKPFADLKGIATLPEVGADSAKSLGAVYVPPGELCFVKLRGGEKAFRGTQRFVMKNARDGLAEREWEISIREASGTETVLASLAIDDKSQLIFQWKPEAKSPAMETISPYFRNCVFSLSCAGESKVVILREPVSGEALSVDFDKAAGSKNDWKIDLCPDPEAVRFQITGVEGAKFTLDPAESQPADKTTVWVRIEDGGGMLSLKLDTLLKRDFLISAVPHIKVSADAPKPDKFVKRMFQDGLKKMEAASQQTTAMVEEMHKYTKSRAPEGERKKVEQRLPVMQLDAKNLAELVQNMKKIDALLKKLEGGMKIQFRVFYDADSTEVDLLKAGS